jgi:hypothetical protein
LLGFVARNIRVAAILVNNGGESFSFGFLQHVNNLDAVISGK